MYICAYVYRDPPRLQASRRLPGPKMNHRCNIKCCWCHTWVRFSFQISIATSFFAFLCILVASCTPITSKAAFCSLESVTPLEGQRESHIIHCTHARWSLSKHYISYNATQQSVNCGDLMQQGMQTGNIALDVIGV